MNKMAMALAKSRIDNIAMPLGGLGKLEDILIKCAGIFGTADFTFNKKAVIVLCADNGIVAQDVTQTGQHVTKIVAENMTDGKASIAILCKQAKADLFVTDIGMTTDSDNPKIFNKKVAYGTRDFSVERAMTLDEVNTAISVGIGGVAKLKWQQYNLIATGEMGIGNTTTSSAIVAALFGTDAIAVTGKGAGLSTKGLLHKIDVINKAIALHQPNPADPFDVLSAVGGLDIAGLVGVYLGGAIHRIPILIDGFISATAALLATRINPAAKDFMFATHVSSEPATKMVLDAIGLEPFLFLDMHLGEGTGAAMAFPLFDMALKIYREMSNFDQINVKKYVPLS